MSGAEYRARVWRGIPALLPLSWIYRGAVAAARRSRTRRRPPSESPRVVSIGNLEVGGSGKTPLAVCLLERALRAGKRAAYVSRGFASAAEKGPWVTVVAPEGAPPPASWTGVRWVERRISELVSVAGDEGAMVAARLPAVPLVLARDKRRAVGTAARLGAEIVVVDDAFQSFSLPRHVDVLLLDAERPLGGGRVLPAGRLREPPSAVARADVIVMNGAADPAAVQHATAQIARWMQPAQRVYGMRRRVSLQPATSAARAAPSAAVLVAAVARPDELRRSVTAAGVRVTDLVAFRDHHRYDDVDAGRIRARARGSAVVTTEKDWVKLIRFDWAGTAVWVARLEVELLEAADVDSWLL